MRQRSASAPSPAVFLLKPASRVDDANHTGRDAKIRGACRAGTPFGGPRLAGQAHFIRVKKKGTGAMSGKPGRCGRKSFVATPEQRNNVKILVGLGVPQAMICQLVVNPQTGKPLDEGTLKKHFPREIAVGAAELRKLPMPPSTNDDPAGSASPRFALHGVIGIHLINEHRHYRAPIQEYNLQGSAA